MNIKLILIVNGIVIFANFSNLLTNGIVLDLGPSSRDTNNCGFIVTSVPVLTTIEVGILKRFGDLTKSIKRRLVVKQGLKPSRLLSKGVAWSRAMHVLKRRLKFLPHLKLFAILRPLRNLKCLFRNSGLISLSNRQQV